MKQLTFQAQGDLAIFQHSGLFPSLEPSPWLIGELRVVPAPGGLKYRSWAGTACCAHDYVVRRLQGVEYKCRVEYKYKLLVAIHTRETTKAGG